MLGGGSSGRRDGRDQLLRPQGPQHADDEDNLGGQEAAGRSPNSVRYVYTSFFIVNNIFKTSVKFRISGRVDGAASLQLYRARPQVGHARRPDCDGDVSERLHAQGEEEGVDHRGQECLDSQVERQLFPGRNSIPSSVLRLRRKDQDQGRLLQEHDHGQPVAPHDPGVAQGRAPPDRNRSCRQLDQLEHQPRGRGGDRRPEAGHRVARDQSIRGPRECQRTQQRRRQDHPGREAVVQDERRPSRDGAGRDGRVPDPPASQIFPRYKNQNLKRDTFSRFIYFQVETTKKAVAIRTTALQRNKCEATSTRCLEATGTAAGVAFGVDPGAAVVMEVEADFEEAAEEEEVVVLEEVKL